MSGEALAEALDYVSNGYKLGPVTVRLVDGKKRAIFHTRWSSPDGISDDPAQVAAWAREHPGCGFHAPTEPNGIVVVDGDVKTDAEGRTLADGVSSWRRAKGPDSTMVVSTRSGGRHWYFRAPEDPIGNSANAISGVPDVDVRGTRLGDKGQAGTVFISGTVVQGDGGHYSANRVVPVAELPELPEQWAERLRKAGPRGDRRRSAPRAGRAQTSRLVGGGNVHDAAWIETKVDDELRELVRRGQGDFRARLFAAAAIAYRAVEAGVLDEDEVDGRLHDAVHRVWGADPDRDDLQWLTEARETAAGDPWRVAAGPGPLEAVVAHNEDDGQDADEEHEHEGPSSYDRLVAAELLTLRAREEARRRLRAEGRLVERPTPALLSDFLAEEDEPAQYRVEGLLPVGARAMLSAQAKAGKSTLRDNLTRSLVDGLSFLGEYKVEPFTGRVVLIDAELDERMLRRWLREQRISTTERVAVVSLRGRVSSFDITDPTVRGEWAEVLQALDPAVVVLDCLRPILDAIGLDEDKDAGRFLVAFDELLAAAGAGEAVLVHHMGHNGERSRGSTRLRDWPDVEWKLTRKDADDPGSPRYFSAYGRDVEVPECELGFDASARALTVVGGGRKDADAAAAAAAIIGLLAVEEGRSGRGIEEALLEARHTRRAIRGGLRLLADGSRVVMRAGARRAHLYYLTDAERRRQRGEDPGLVAGTSAPVRRSAPPVRRGTESECASAPIGGALTRTGEDEGSAPHGDVA